MTVTDDREAFASAERFPEADRVLCGEYTEIFRELEETQAGYYVVVTRGHLGGIRNVSAEFSKDRFGMRG